MNEAPCPDCRRDPTEERGPFDQGGGKIDCRGDPSFIKEALDFFNQSGVDLHGLQRIAQGILKEIEERLKFMMEVGLDYLTLDRTGGHPLRGRISAHPSGHPDRVEPGGRALHSR